MTSHHVRRFVASVAVLSLGPIPARAQRDDAVRRVTLQQAVEIALAQGHQARAAAAARDAARYRHDAFYSRLLPQLSLTGTLPSYNRSIIPVLQPDGSTLFRAQNQTEAELGASLSQTLPFTGGSIFMQSSLSRISVSGTENLLTWSSTPFVVGLQQPLFQANTIGWDRREQPVRIEAADRQYRESREDVAIQTTLLFFDHHSAAVELQTARTNAATNDTLYTLNQGRFQIGSIGENDLLQSELALLRARTAAAEAELEFERTKAALLMGLNLPAATGLEIVVPSLPPDFPVDTAIAVTEALGNLSVLSALELQDVQARRSVAEAKYGNNFSATLTASYGFNATGANFGRAYDELLNAQRVRFQVDVPIVQWGAGKEAVRAAEAEREQIARLAEAQVEQVEHDARFAALALVQARRNLALSATSDTVAQKRFDVAYNRYVIGNISIDNLYLAQQEKDEARRRFVLALRGYWQAYYRLRRATLYDFERGERIR
jgi:outer membrane protein TolC